MMYLTVDEQSNYIDVFCDGYVLRVHKSQLDNRIASIRDEANTTNLIYISDNRVHASTIYFLGYDENKTITIIENNTTRVVFVLSGNYDSTYTGNSYLSGSTGVELLFTVYQDHFTVVCKWETSSDIVIDNDTDSNGVLVSNNGTSVANIYGTITETSGTNWTNLPDENYIGSTATEIDILFSVMHQDVEAPTGTQAVWGAGASVAGWNDGTIASGVHKQNICVVIDSAERDGGKQYTSTERLLLGNQYHDIPSNTTLPDITTGSAVTDLNIPNTDFGKPGYDRALITDHPLANGLVGSWIMNENTGTDVHDATGSNDGNMAASDGWITDGLDINSDSDRKVSIGDLDDLYTDGITIVAKVKTGASIGTWLKIAANDSVFLRMPSATSDGFRFGVYNGTATVIEEDSEGGILSTDTEYTLAGTYDGAELIVYKDGVKAGGTPPTQTGDIDDSTGDMYLGGQSDTSNVWNGEIHYVHIYNRALSAQEIAQIHDDPYQMFRHGMATDGAYHIDLPQPQDKPKLSASLISGHSLADGLVGAWLMNEGSGDTVADYAGTADFTNISGPDWVDGGLDFIQANSDYMSVTTSGLPQDFPFTIIAIVNNGASPGLSSSICAYNDGTLDGYTLKMEQYNNTGYIGFTIHGSLDYSRADSNLTTPANRSIVSAIVTASNINLGMNGYFDDITHSGTILGTLNNFQIGRTRSSDYLDSNVETIYIYNRALSAEEIASLHADPYQMFRVSHSTKLDFQQDEINPAIELHEASVRTGTVGSEDEHLLVQWNCDSDTLDVFDATDGDTVELGDSSFVLGKRGNGIEIPNSGDGVYITATDGNNVSLDTGAISFDFKQTETFAGYSRMFQFGLTSADFALYCPNAEGFTFRYAENSYSFDGPGGSGVHTNIFDGEWHNITLTWDKDGKAILWLDGLLTDDNVELAGNSPVPNGDNLYIASDAVDSGAGGIIDNFCIYDTPILPYGSFIPGNLTDYSKAHSDITAYIHGDEADSDALKIGTGDITVTGATHVTGPDGIANSAFHSDGDGDGTDYALFPLNSDAINTRGKISFWYRHLDTSSSTYASVFGHSSGEEFFRGRIPSSILVSFYLPDGSEICNLDCTDYWDGLWHYFEIVYDADLDYVTLTLDGVFQDDANPTFSSGDLGSGNIIVGNYSGLNRDCGGDIHGFTITNNPNTPQVPFIPGHGPIHQPLLSKNGTLQQVGSNHNIVWVP